MRRGAIPVSVFFDAAARASGFTVADLRTRKHDRSVVHWRRVAIFLARCEGWPAYAIALFVGCPVARVSYDYREVVIAAHRSAPGIQTAIDRALIEVLPPLVTVDELDDYTLDPKRAT